MGMEYGSGVNRSLIESSDIPCSESALRLMLKTVEEKKTEMSTPPNASCQTAYTNIDM